MLTPSRLGILGDCGAVRFVHIRGAAAAHDRDPAEVLLWLDERGEDGTLRALPQGILLTSKARTAKGLKTRHYALIAHAPIEDALEPTIHSA